MDDLVVNVAKDRRHKVFGRTAARTHIIAQRGQVELRMAGDSDGNRCQ